MLGTTLEDSVRGHWHADLGAVDAETEAGAVPGPGAGPGPVAEPAEFQCPPWSRRQWQLPTRVKHFVSFSVVTMAGVTVPPYFARISRTAGEEPGRRAGPGGSTAADGAKGCGAPWGRALSGLRPGLRKTLAKHVVARPVSPGGNPGATRSASLSRTPTPSKEGRSHSSLPRGHPLPSARSSNP